MPFIMVAYKSYVLIYHNLHICTIFLLLFQAIVYNFAGDEGGLSGWWVCEM